MIEYVHLALLLLIVALLVARIVWDRRTSK
jgi:hypothetical protein